MHAAQVVAGISNLAVQDTSQSATNSISSVNAAGRHLLDGKQQCAVDPHSCYDQPQQPDAVMSCGQETTHASLKHTLCLCSADGSKWQKVTLQYLDTNNKIVSTQVAVPSECDHVLLLCLYLWPPPAGSRLLYPLDCCSACKHIHVVQR